ncbi:MAG: DUF2071 domain-containing protein [Pyrinomonadaceae bacterium]
MRLPTIQGVIKRRILVNFRADPETVQNILPAGFRPKLHKGQAIAGICLIRLEHTRPMHTPAFIGIKSENAAHRIAVEWDEAGSTREGVFIPRRDTDSTLNAFAGGRLFPGEHNLAEFNISEDDKGVDLSMRSKDGGVTIDVKSRFSNHMPAGSIFESLDESSKFFEAGSLGYSVTRDGKYLDGITLKTKEWVVKPLAVDGVTSSFYNDKEIFPESTIKFDHALIMQNVEHEWHSAPNYDLS